MSVFWKLSKLLWYEKFTQWKLCSIIYVTVYNSNNGHYYLYVQYATSFLDAYFSAGSLYGYPISIYIMYFHLMYHTGGSYLATITSEGESEWVKNTFNRSNYWIGHVDYGITL